MQLKNLALYSLPL